MKNHLSLSRLSFLYHKSELPENLQLGARLVDLREGKGLFIGQNSQLIADLHEFSDLTVGDLVSIQANAQDLTLETEQDAETEAFYLHKIKTVEILSKSQGQFEIQGAHPINYQRWSIFIHRVCEILKSIGLNAVSTPTLVNCPGTEPTLDFFSTQFEHGAISKKYYLPTSPELHLKKLICADHTDIYEVRSCFRNNEVSDWHQPEFTMLEWYRAFSDLDKMKCDVESLFFGLVRAYQIQVSWQGIESLTVAQLFSEHLKFELRPDTTFHELMGLARKLGLDTNYDTWVDIFNWIFVTQIEKRIPVDRPIFLQDYPHQLAALSKINSEGWADRFEIYYKGLEIGNAFNELTDPQEHLVRYKADSELRDKFNKAKLPNDEQFLQGIRHGLPPSSGIAVGLDRLFMAFKGYSKISDFKAFCF